jgi:hypothetical protein
MINISQLAKGIYLVKIKAGNKAKISKIIKE